eukprot:1692663-Rhodomonas_salina.1
MATKSGSSSACSHHAPAHYRPSPRTRLGRWRRSPHRTGWSAYLLTALFGALGVIREGRWTGEGERGGGKMQRGSEGARESEREGAGRRVWSGRAVDWRVA